ncbi:hypothetical protein WMY93_018139 [Mugilogobius chulae]|uniref:Uncharacterized protein n=1 Tax=Mugilogobius chulae TaxID=88201 RepID=A0AAW0NHZ6_9GOBI
MDSNSQTNAETEVVRHSLTGAQQLSIALISANPTYKPTTHRHTIEKPVPIPHGNSFGISGVNEDTTMSKAVPLIKDGSNEGRLIDTAGLASPLVTISPDSHMMGMTAHPRAGQMTATSPDIDHRGLNVQNRWAKYGREDGLVKWSLRKDK